MVIRGVDTDKFLKSILTDSGGRLIVVWRGADYPIREYEVLSDTDETLVWAPETGKKFVITDIIISADANSNITFRDGLAGYPFLVVNILASTTIPMSFHTPIVSTTAENYLTAQASATTVFITVLGYEI